MKPRVAGHSFSGVESLERWPGLNVSFFCIGGPQSRYLFVILRGYSFYYAIHTEVVPAYLRT